MHGITWSSITCISYVISAPYDIDHWDYCKWSKEIKMSCPSNESSHESKMDGLVAHVGKTVYF